MSTPFNVHVGTAFVLMRSNIDTDQIIPSREIKRVSKEGLGEGLFAGWRYLDEKSRTPNPSFGLNDPPFDRPTILVADENFGCGSSREQAVWALMDFGFRCVIAPSFGDIFFNNCLANGLLSISLESAACRTLATSIQGGENDFQLRVDLPSQTISPTRAADDRVPFRITKNHKKILINGLNAVGLTQVYQDKIRYFIERDEKKRPWAYSFTGS